jgi:hypothetical protein
VPSLLLSLLHTLHHLLLCRFVALPFSDDADPWHETLLLQELAENWDCFQQTEGHYPGSLASSRSGKIMHAGLNACRNIALKFCERYYSKPLLVTGRCVERSIQIASG